MEKFRPGYPFLSSGSITLDAAEATPTRPSAPQ